MAVSLKPQKAKAKSRETSSQVRQHEPRVSLIERNRRKVKYSKQNKSIVSLPYHSKNKNYHLTVRYIGENLNSRAKKLRSLQNGGNVCFLLQCIMGSASKCFDQRSIPARACSVLHRFLFSTRSRQDEVCKRNRG